MKSIFSILMLLGVVAYGANEGAPKVVSKAFSTKYKGAENVYWVVEQGNHQVSFEHENFTKEATFKKDGTWVMTVTTLDTENLMTCINDVLNDDYFGPVVLDAEFVEKPDSEKYYITIEDAEEFVEDEEGDEEGGEEETSYIRLVFASDCEFLGEEQLADN